MPKESPRLDEVEPDTAKPLEIMPSESHHFINRELSLLQFNWRVLKLALDESTPLLDRIIFIFICSNNLDEFFEVRVSSLRHKLLHDRFHSDDDGKPPAELYRLVHESCHDLVAEQYRIFNDVMLPQLAEENIHFIRRAELTAAQSEWMRDYFHTEVLPVVSPIGLDLAHPFPNLINKSLHFIIQLEGKDAFGRDSGLAVVHMPRSLPRIIRLPDEICDSGDNFVFLSSIVHDNADALFPGMKVKGCYQFRLTRDSDLLFDEEAVDDLATALRKELQSRDFGLAVRLEVVNNCPQEIQDFLLQKCQLGPESLYIVEGPVNLNRLMALPSLLNRPDLHWSAFSPALPSEIKGKQNIFQAITTSDIVLYHPYDSFLPVIDFVREAARDPNVLAIKQTFYRSESDSAMGNALLEAARLGKEVTACVELRARFDEQGNINLATQLQNAGAQVVYGIIGHKTHAKLVLVVRREGEKLKRYVHMGTGNYHANNAKLYTDIGLLTADEEIGEDVHKIFMQLTGMGKATKLRKLFQAPFTLKTKLKQLIEMEREQVLAGGTGKIILKVNSLTDKKLIKALYRASQAGVEIDLVVRGICCLRPGVEGLSENIRVRSVVGRFLEHTRIFYFYSGGQEKLYCASADWMERNLYKRVEVCFPILDKKKKQWIFDNCLDIYLRDNCQAWQLHADGSYTKCQRQPGEKKVSAQTLLLNSY